MNLRTGTLLTTALIGFLASAGVAFSTLVTGASTSLLASSDAALLASTTVNNTTTTTNTVNTATVQLQEPSQIGAQAGACGSGIVHIGWQQVSGAQGYYLMRNGTAIYGGIATTYTDSGLSADTSFNYTVQAYANTSTSNKAGISVHSPPPCATVSSTTSTGGGTTVQSASASSTTLQATQVQGGTGTNPVGTQVVPPRAVLNPPASDAGARRTETPDAPVATMGLRSTEKTLAPAKQPAPSEATIAKTEAFKVATDAVVANREQVVKTRSTLLSLIDAGIASRQGTMTAEQAVELAKVRSALVSQIDEKMQNPLLLSSSDIEKLKVDILKGLARVYGADSAGQAQNSAKELLTQLASTTERTSADYVLVYKDSNHDGISDYDAKYIYNIDPKATPVNSTLNGKTLTPEEKILLGYDPNSKELLTVYPEDPIYANIAYTDAYRVSAVTLASSSRVTLTGEGLPNSFVTLYIKSTPVVVTVKTDASGKWQYTLVSELENGSHHVTVATVDATGKILAKSRAFAFTKTAEAATLDGLAPDQPAESPTSPSFFESNRMYVLGGAFLLMLLFALVIMGIGVRMRGATALAGNQPTPPNS